MPNDNLPEKSRGRPFVRGTSGNPSGRPRGARNRATLAAEALLSDETEKLTRKAVEVALTGDVNALRLCLDRIVPPRRELTFNIELTRLGSLQDASRAMADVLSSVAAGEITLSQGIELGKLIDLYVRTCEALEKSEHDEKRLQFEEFRSYK